MIERFMFMYDSVNLFDYRFTENHFFSSAR